MGPSHGQDCEVSSADAPANALADVLAYADALVSANANLDTDSQDVAHEFMAADGAELLALIAKIKPELLPDFSV